MMLSALTGVPELQIDKKEAEALAEAASEVAKFYPIVLDPKTLAWYNLMLVSSSVYGLRMIAFFNRIRAEARSKIAAPPTVPPASQPRPASNEPGGDRGPAPRPNGAPANDLQSHLRMAPQGDE